MYHEIGWNNINFQCTALSMSQLAKLVGNHQNNMNSTKELLRDRSTLGKKGVAAQLHKLGNTETRKSSEAKRQSCCNAKH